MSEWEEYQLDKVIEKFIDYRGKTPKKVTSGIPLITAKVIKDGTILPPDEFIEPAEYSSWMTRGLPKVNDVLITTEAPLGEVALVQNENIALAQRIILLRGKFDIIDNRFLFYSLQTELMQHRLSARASGSTVQGIKSAELKKVLIPLPDVNTQKQIVLTLSCLDRKIENLRRQNETLEQIAQTLFKHWFVDFEFPNEDGKPYKSSGGEMVRSELGEIPAGWRVGKLGDVTVTITKGTTPTTLKKQFQDSGINFVKAESITDDHSMDSSKFAYIDEETNQLLKRSILEAKDIVYTIAGTIGRYAMVSESVLPANTNQAVAIIRPDIEKVDPEYLLCYFSSKSYQHYLSSRVVQAVQANLSLGILSDSPIVLPDKNIKVNFGRLAKAIFQKKEENHKQIQTLTKTRDVLLPKLMSGKLRIAE